MDFPTFTERAYRMTLETSLVTKANKVVEPTRSRARLTTDVMSKQPKNPLKIGTRSMRHRLLMATCIGLLFVLVGWGETPTAVYPPSDGDFVTNSDGRGTANVWGIRFDVADPVGGGAGSKFAGGLHSDPEQTDARIRLTLGDDVSIQLEKVPGSPITFKLNGKMYGALEVGDKVVIDKERKVKVNDTARQSESTSL